MSASAVVLVLLVLGVTVAVAREMRRSDARGTGAMIGDFVVTALAWPFYLPSVLAHGAGAVPETAHGATRGPAHREPSRHGPTRHGPATSAASARPESARIDRVERTLEDTLGELSGVALDAMRPEIPRLRGLAAGLRPWVARLAALEAELARPECDRTQLDATLAELSARGYAEDDARIASVRARRSSLDRLAALHARSAEELERALLELEELTTELRVLRFAVERPGDEAIERLRHLATSVAAVRDAVLATT